MRTFGRMLQLAGLVILPVACLAQVSDGLGRHFGVSDLVLWSAFGLAAFLLGRYLEAYAAS